MIRVNPKQFCQNLTIVLQVMDDTRKWWKTRNCHGETGHVPHTIVTHLGDVTPPPPPVSPKSADWVQKERRGKKGEFRYF